MVQLFDNYFGKIAKEDDTTVFGFENISNPRSDKITIPNEGGCYGYVSSGEIIIAHHRIKAGYWFSTASGFDAYLMGDTRFIVIQQKGYNGMEAIGKVETEGRLKYIDGCYDTILSSPIKKGLPCLNALYMPPMINQTAHIHPSARVGIIISGRGKCITPERELDLYGGQVFVIPKNGVHSFNTMQRGNKLAIIAYHPDSDFGATDHDHPMINLTIVDGKSAKNLEAIRTK